MVNRVFGVLFIICGLLPALADASLVADAALFSMVPLFGAGLLLLFKKAGIQEALLPVNRLRSLCAGLLALLFFVMLSGTQLFSCGLFSPEAVFHVYDYYFYDAFIVIETGQFAAKLLTALMTFAAWALFPACLLLSVFTVLYAAFGLPGFADAKDDGLPLTPMRITGFYRVTLAVAALTIAFLFSAMPTLLNTNGDIRYCLDTVQLDYEEWTDWHTVTYMYLLKWATTISATPFPLALAQAILWICVNNFAVDTLNRYVRSAKACRLYVLLSVLLFTPYVFLQVLYKDVLFSMAILGLSVSILRALREEKMRAGTLIPMVLFATLASLIRHAGIVSACAPLLVLLLQKLRRGWREALKAFAALLCPIVSFVLVVQVISFGMLNMQRNPGYVKYSVPMAMLAAVAASGEEIDAEDQALLEEITSMDVWRTGYDKYYADSISRTWGKIGYDVLNVDERDMGPALLRLNAKYLLRYPKLYLTAFFDMNSIIWEIARPSDGYEVTLAVTDEENAPQSYEYAQTGLTGITAQLAAFTRDTPVLRTIYWRGGLWAFLTVLCAALLCFKRRGRELTALLPPLTTVALLMVSTPSQEMRYMLGVMECGIFFLPYALAVPAGKRTK